MTGTPKTMFQALLNSGLDELQAAQAYLHVKDYIAQHCFHKDLAIDQAMIDNFKIMFKDAEDIITFLNALKAKQVPFISPESRL